MFLEDCSCRNLMIANYSVYTVKLNLAERWPKKQKELIFWYLLLVLIRL